MCDNEMAIAVHDNCFIMVLYGLKIYISIVMLKGLCCYCRNHDLQIKSATHQYDSVIFSKNVNKLDDQ